MDMIVNLLGYAGVILLLLAYFLLVIGQLKVSDTHHITLNLLGALLVAIALHAGSAVPLLATVVLWLLISLFGLYKHHVATSD